jgi:2-C-methyl-D-erythritol 4-phosphate cytidylyltransferase
MHQGKKVGVIIPAAGSGRRMGAAVPKALLPLGGVPILVHTLRRVQQCSEVDDIVLVVRPGDHQEVENALSGEGPGRVRAILPGGAERQDSVRIGLAALLARGVGIVLVHDAVRPFVDAATIAAVIEAAYDHGAAVAAIRAKDTVKIIEREGGVPETPDRATCWLAQTPQGFRADLFSSAMEKATSEGVRCTDDAGLVERLGHKVIIVQGTERNLKVTTPEDLELAVFLLGSGHRPL